jgi:hypothetical protein
MKSFDPSWKDRIAAALMGDGQATPERKRVVEGIFGTSGLGSTGLSLSDVIPGVGQVLGAQEAANNGDYRGAAMQAMFLGPAARTADHVALATAQKMAAAGADRAAIHDATKWFQGVDDKWRFEIPDNQARMDLAGKASFGPTPDYRRAGDFMRHDALDAAYPGLMDTRTAVSMAPGELEGNFYGARNVGSRLVPSSIDVTAPTTADAKSGMLHELQHSIQGIEGFAGASANSPGMDDLYTRLAHEVEARNVQARMNMTQQQRMALKPWQTLDVPESQQVISGAGY